MWCMYSCIHCFLFFGTFSFPLSKSLLVILLLIMASWLLLKNLIGQLSVLGQNRIWCFVFLINVLNHVHNVTSLTCGASVEKNWGKEVLSAAGSFVPLLCLTVQMNEMAKRTTGKKVTCYNSQFYSKSLQN